MEDIGKSLTKNWSNEVGEGFSLKLFLSAVKMQKSISFLQKKKKIFLATRSRKSSSTKLRFIDGQPILKEVLQHVLYILISKPLLGQCWLSEIVFFGTLTTFLDKYKKYKNKKMQNV